MYPTAVTICLIALGIFIIIGLMCDWCELRRLALFFAICAAIAGIYPLVWLMTLPPVI